MIKPRLSSMLRRGVSEIIVEQELLELLKKDKPLRLKQGFDPSRSDIHLGHVVGLKKLRQFQELGHQIVLIVGDWTAQIGDPSGRSVMRTMLSAEEVRANAETYMQQFFKVIDKAKTEVRWQSEWFGDFGLSDVIKLTNKFTVAQMLARDDFSKRYVAGNPIAITELIYPLLTAYDSVVIKSDVEFGGIDQKFNCLVGRELQEMDGQKPQHVLLMPLLVGTDGSQKMSKSLNNYIALNDPPNDMYGKVMSIPDNLIMNYFELVTDVSDEELLEFRSQLESQSINPMVLKKRLAQEIVTQFHDASVAQDAGNYFASLFQKNELPDDIPEYYLPIHKIQTESFLKEVNSGKDPSEALDAVQKQSKNTKRSSAQSISVNIIDLLAATGLTSSKGEAKRMLAQGAVEIDGKKINENTPAEIQNNSIVRVGKRRFVKLVDANRSLL